jgi:hypothetical protein
VKTILKWISEKKKTGSENADLNSSHSGQDPVVSFCEDGNESSGYAQGISSQSYTLVQIWLLSDERNMNLKYGI